jgi:NHL repeat
MPCLSECMVAGSSAQVGCGAPALKDGSYAEAAFRRPQGLAYCAKRDVLYVADTENHALREVDLRIKTVRTLAGVQSIYLSVTSLGRTNMWCTFLGGGGGCPGP